ncbi:glycosyltransferase [Actinomadura miaoliensis]|uniref:Hyaluronan synthase HasA n=1 Tax=Actinomadura miaoliensis TaxID=430685 RepID=A0ABP7W7L6_9ACTN
MLSVITGHIGWYGACVGSVLLLKLLLSIPIARRRQPQLPGQAPDLVTAAIITVYNEDPATLRRCLDSLLAQTRLPQAITVVDDASVDRDAVAVAHSYTAPFRALGVDYAVIEFTENQGKRHGLAAGFKRSWRADIYMCVDSDTVLAPDATEQALRGFADPRVQCVTGLVLALNRSTNLLTRLIDMRYVNAFLGERVAYSRLGSVLCACGSLALYRGPVVRRNLTDFLYQDWLFRPAIAGDDRRLTFYCLMEGRAIIQPAAVAWTAVPERLPHYLRQQTRWTKSFLRESLLMVATSPRRPCWWLNLIELATWMLFTGALIVAVATLALQPQWWALAVSYLAYVCAAAWVRSLHYMRGAARVPRRERVATFLAAPLYAVMNLVLLVPLRLWAIGTMRDSSWGTRKRVEVTDAAQPMPEDAGPAPASPETAPMLRALSGPRSAATVEPPAEKPSVEAPVEPPVAPTWARVGA